MKYLKISIIVLMLLTLLLITSSPASARATRIDYYAIGGDGCAPALDPPHVSGPNVHVHGTYTCFMTSYDMDGNILPMATGTVIWTDAYLQAVDGQSILRAQTRFVTIEGGVFEGSFSWPATGVLIGVMHGQGMYEGIHRFATYNPADGMEMGYMLITK